MKTDLDKLQGTWRIVALELDGQKMGAIPADACITVKGARFITSGMGAEYEGDLTLDAAAKPKRFNLAFQSGPEKGNTSLGIYDLEGDAWRICLTTRGGKRPAKFASVAGSGIALETLVREGSAKIASTAKARPAAAAAEPAPAPAGEPAPELDGEWTLQTLVMDGKALPASMVKGCKRTAKDGEVRVTMGPQTIIHARFAVDRSRSPMEMNYVHVRGGNSQLGIYKLEGKVLTTCIGAAGGARPDGFASAAGDGRTLTVWKKK
jgi:uncharacterized protein (TIGR03067 family)